MQSYFNVFLEFDKQEVDHMIQTAIVRKEKGYVCSVESNNLTIANNNPAFLNVLNNSLVNICDGSVLAKILGFIYKENYTSYIGADLFKKYVEMSKYKQYFLGNTTAVLAGLKQNLSLIDQKIADMPFVELPFRKVEEFDYESIAKDINTYAPEIIWVSLGAPKQEMFMYNLLPYLDRGIMFGFGAIFNFNAGIGQVKRAPQWMLKLKLEWLYRAMEEPKKNVPRYTNFVKILPRLIRNEYKKKAGQT